MPYLPLFLAVAFGHQYLGTFQRCDFGPMTKNDQHVLLRRQPARKIILTGYHHGPYMAGDFRRQYLGTFERYGFRAMTKNDPHGRLLTSRYFYNEFDHFLFGTFGALWSPNTTFPGKVVVDTFVAHKNARRWRL